MHSDCEVKCATKYSDPASQVYNTVEIDNIIPFHYSMLAVQTYFEGTSVYFCIRRHLRFGNCGGLGRGKICCGSKHKVEKMGKGEG